MKVAKDDWLAYINRAYILCCIFFSLWACMYVYIYIYTHIYMYTYIYI